MNKKSLKVDHKLCWGCLACEVACKQEHHSPAGVKRIRVSEKWSHKPDGEPDFNFRVNFCRQCDTPLCVPACPENAIGKDPQTRIVLIEAANCTGCGECAAACPFDAVAVNPKTAKAEKCDLCYFRVVNGLIPACADNICLGHCIYFGDPDEVQKQYREIHHRLFDPSADEG